MTQRKVQNSHKVGTVSRAKVRAAVRRVLRDEKLSKREKTKAGLDITQRP